MNFMNVLRACFIDDDIANANQPAKRACGSLDAKVLSIDPVGESSVLTACVRYDE